MACELGTIYLWRLAERTGMKVEKEGSTLRYLLYLVVVLIAILAVYMVYVSM